MEHPAIVALLCLVLLIWLRSRVPLQQRTKFELRLAIAWDIIKIAVLERAIKWLGR
jgi:hypothetical protein